MHNIRGIIFLGACNEEFSSEGSKNSLSMMVEQSACNSVEFVISAIQDNAQSVQVRYKHSYMPDDKDIIDLISYAQKLNIKIILKLNITCLNGQSQSEIRAGDESNSFISNWF